MALEKSKRFRHFVKEVCCCCCCCFVSFIHSFHLKCELYGRTYDTSQIHCACEKVHTREGKHTRNFESFNFLFVVIVRAVIRHRVVVHVFLQVHQYQLQLYIRLLLRRISCILSVAASSQQQQQQQQRNYNRFAEMRWRKSTANMDKRQQQQQPAAPIVEVVVLVVQHWR